jgi:hypothetical protein
VARARRQRQTPDERQQPLVERVVASRDDVKGIELVGRFILPRSSSSVPPASRSTTWLPARAIVDVAMTPEPGGTPVLHARNDRLEVGERRRGGRVECGVRGVP